MKPERFVALQCWIGATNLIDSRDQWNKRTRGVAISLANLVLLAHQVLFRLGFPWSRLRRSILAQLIGGAIHSVVGCQRGCQNQAKHEGRTATVLQRLVEDV